MQLAGAGIGHRRAAASTALTMLTRTAVDPQIVHRELSIVTKGPRIKPNVPQITLPQVGIRQFVRHGQATFDPPVAGYPAQVQSGGTTAPGRLSAV